MTKRSMLLVAAMSFVLAACGGGAEPTGTTASPDPIDDGTTTTSQSGGPGTTATTAPAPSGGGGVTVSVDGTEYQLSVADDIQVAGVNFPTRCEPNFFGTGMFWVIAVAVDESGARATDPEVGLSLGMFPTAEDAAAADEELEFTLDIDTPNDSFEYTIATHSSVVFQTGEFTGDLGSWTIDGNRIYGEITVYEYDHVREYFTATFDVTCPAG